MWVAIRRLRQLAVEAIGVNAEAEEGTPQTGSKLEKGTLKVAGPGTPLQRVLFRRHRLQRRPGDCTGCLKMPHMRFELFNCEKCGIQFFFHFHFHVSCEEQDSRVMNTFHIHAFQTQG